MRKNFFFIKIFRPIRFREKIKFNQSIFCSLESTDEWPVMHKKFYWPLLYSRDRWEKIFFLTNFSTNQISTKNQIQFFHFFTIGIEWPVNTDAEKILLTFIWCPESVRKNYFFIEIFRLIRLPEKIKFNQLIFCSLESTNKCTLMLRKLFSFSRDPLFPWRNDKKHVLFIILFEFLFFWSYQIV